MTWTQTHNFQALHQRKRNTIRRESVLNTGNIIRQTHCHTTILIRPTTVITDANKGRIRVIKKSI